MIEHVSDDLIQENRLDVDADALEMLEEDLSASQSLRSFKSPLTLFIEDLANRLFANRATTALATGVMLACIALIGWNLFFRLPDPAHLEQLTVDKQDKTERLQVLTRRFQEIDRSDIEEQLEVENVRVFKSYPKMALWIDAVAKRAATGNIDVTYRVDDPHTAPIQDVLEVPIVIDFSTQDSQRSDLFGSAMAIVGDMLADQWHLDIISTTARGGSDGLSRMQVTAQVWVTDSEGFSTAPELAAAIAGSPDRISSEEFVQ